MTALSLPELLTDLADPRRRRDALVLLARRFGASNLLVLVPDPKTGRPCPVPGLPQTLPGSTGWRAFLRTTRTPGEHSGTVEAPGGGDLHLAAWTTERGDTLVLFEPSATCRPARIARLFDLALALFRSEIAVALASAAAKVAEDAAEQTGRLLGALEGARAELAREAQALGEALVMTEHAKAALEQANRSLDVERLAAERAANVDALTNVASRAAFEARLRQCIDAAAIVGENVSLLLIDLDGFKEVNDTRGHAAGDAVLAAVGARLGMTCEARMAVGRLGGDEFAVVVPGQDLIAASIHADRVRQVIREPVRFGSEDLFVSGTFGLATYPTDAGTAYDLLRKADVALYSAKRNNKGALGRYSAEIEFLFDERRRAILLLRRGLDEHRIEAHYQPKVSLKDGRIKGFEALARLRGEGGVIRPPSDFWAALSDQESARLLGNRMFDLVLADLAACRATGRRVFPVAINVSGPELGLPGFAASVLTRMDRFGIEGKLIEVEVTETALLSDHPARLRAAIMELRRSGLSVALDDFGTGYSSLSHLLDWEVDCVKIDRSFVSGLGTSERSTRIVRSIMDLARGLKIRVVAEGVETTEQATFLKRIRCPLAQGYLFGRALPVEETLFSDQQAIANPTHHSSAELSDSNPMSRIAL